MKRAVLVTVGPIVSSLVPELLNFLMKILKLLMNLFGSSFRKASLSAVLPQLCGFEF